MRARTTPGQPRWRYSVMNTSLVDRPWIRCAASATAKPSWGGSVRRQSATVRDRVVTGMPCESAVISSSGQGATSTCSPSRRRVGPSVAVTATGGQPPHGSGRRQSRAAWAWLTTTSRCRARTTATVSASRGCRPGGARTPRRSVTSRPSRIWRVISWLLAPVSRSSARVWIGSGVPGLGRGARLRVRAVMSGTVAAPAEPAHVVQGGLWTVGRHRRSGDATTPSSRARASRTTPQPAHAPRVTPHGPKSARLRVTSGA